MKTVRLYRITEDGRTTVTPKKPTKSGYKTLSRLIADPGKVLTDGNIQVSVIDTDIPADWSEIDKSAE